jgi:nucleosome binding factor SPN SPT16 subunit
MIADMVEVNGNGASPAELLTKHAKLLTDISYTLNDEDEDDADDDDGDGTPHAPDGDAELARKLAAENHATGGDGGDGNGDSGNTRSTRQRSSARLALNGNAEANEGAAEREKKQIKLLQRRNEERLREAARRKKKNNGQSEEEGAQELSAYKRTKDYPPTLTVPNQVKVDMANETVILPMCGVPVAFHISTIKNVVLPDPDIATFLRLNFYTPGVTLGKDAPPNMAKLVEKHGPYATFIRELTFRSLDGQNLTQVCTCVCVVLRCAGCTFTYRAFHP